MDMSNVTCIESFSDIVAVWPFMEGGISYAFPFNVRKKTVTLSELGKDTVENLTAGKTCLSTGQTYGDTVSVSLEDGELGPFDNEDGYCRKISRSGLVAGYQ